MLRIIAVDGHPIALKGLKEIMREGFPDSTLDGTGSGREAVRRIENGGYDLAIMEIALLDMDGFEVLKQIKKKKPGLPVLVLSAYPEEQYAMRVIKAGGDGYLTKRSTSDELVQAAGKILSGKRYVNPAFAEKVVFDFESRPERLPYEELSGRELRVARLIGTGKTIKEINEELGVSINTVRTYRARVLRKIGLKGTNELIHYVVKHFLAE